MNPLNLQKDNQRLYLQRKYLLCIAGAMIAANLALSICLFGKSDKTIIVPAQLGEPISVSSSELSESYIEQMTEFFSGLLLDLTPSNVGYKSAVALKHVDSSGYTELQNYFKEEEEKHKKYNLATHFSPTCIKVLSNLEREVSGILTSRFGDAGKQETHVSYRIKYRNKGGRLWLEKFELLKK